MRRRFFVERFEEGGAVVRGEEAHHLARVLRAKPGQKYELSDGRTAWLGRVARVDRHEVAFALVEPLPAAAAPLEATLLLSLFRYARFEWAIEKATELGATAIQVVAAERSERGLVEAAGKRLERWEKIAREAAKQSRRVNAPRLLPPLRSAEAFRACAAERRVLFSERQDAPPLARWRPSEPTASVALAFGPEGGWTDGELEAAREAGFQEASLGPLILRAETAAIAGLAIVLGTWPAA